MLWLNDVLPGRRRGIIGRFGYFVTSLLTYNGNLVLVLGLNFILPWDNKGEGEVTQRNHVEKSNSVFTYYLLLLLLFFFVELKRDFSQVFIVFAGLEPKSFKNLFPFWEDRPDVAKINRAVG